MGKFNIVSLNDKWAQRFAQDQPPTPPKKEEIPQKLSGKEELPEKSSEKPTAKKLDPEDPKVKEVMENYKKAIQETEKKKENSVRHPRALSRPQLARWL